METPDFQLLLLPLLECLRDGKARSIADINTELNRYVELSDEKLIQFIPDEALMEGVWKAKNHLLKAGLVANTKGDNLMITSLGKMVLNKRLNSLDVDFLRRLPGYLE